MNNKKQNSVLTPDEYERLAKEGVTSIAKKAREKAQLIASLEDKKEKILELKEEIMAAKEELRETRKEKRNLNKAIRSAKRFIVSRAESVETLNNTLMSQKLIKSDPKVKKHA